MIPSGRLVEVGHVTTGQGSGVGQVDGGGHVTSGQLSQVQGGGDGHVAGAVVGGVSVRALLSNISYCKLNSHFSDYT